jgi:hypothetical protein
MGHRQTAKSIDAQWSEPDTNQGQQSNKKGGRSAIRSPPLFVQATLGIKQLLLINPMDATPASLKVSSARR